jgi:hypothetical protein
MRDRNLGYLCDRHEAEFVHARKLTDMDRLQALAAAVPGDAASWAALAKEASDILDKSRSKRSRDEGGGGDGTIDATTWAHLRNLHRAMADMEFVLRAIECGDDPDIPF